MIMSSMQSKRISWLYSFGAICLVAAAGFTATAVTTAALSTTVETAERFLFRQETTAAMPGEKLTPQQTLEQLEHFNSVLPEDGITKKKVQLLIDACRITHENCRAKEIKLLGAMISFVAYNPNNVIPYLRDCRRQQLDLCAKVLDSKVRQAVAGLAPTERSYVPKLSLNLGTSPVAANVPVRSLGKAALAMMEASVGDASLKSLGQKIAEFKEPSSTFKEIYEDTVANSCQSVEKGFDAALALYDLLIYEDDVKIDADNLDWIMNAKICRIIMKKKYNLTLKEAYLTLLEKS